MSFFVLLTMSFSQNDIVFSGAFGGTYVDGNTYTNPTGSEGWAGFANEDVSIYPFSFPDGGEINFTGSTAGADVDVYFRFEYNPYPDTEPSFSTESVTVSGAGEASYSVSIPAQGSNTFSSFLLYVTTLDAPVTLTNVSVTGGGSGDGGGDVLGCLDSNAANYNPDATVQEEDQWGNLVCVYASCDDVPYDGCMYADAFAGWNESFGPSDCENYGGTPCEASTDPVVTLNVDMNCVEDIEYTGVFVNGPSFGWCGDCVPMSDDDGDGVWSVTLTDIPAGDLEYKYTLDGWANQEDLIDDMNSGASTI